MTKIVIVGRTTNNIFSPLYDIAYTNKAMRDIDKRRLEQFGVHLAKLRKKKGLSMRELAARCDIDYAKISKLENNKANITLTTLIELAEGLGVHPKELINIPFE